MLTHTIPPTHVTIRELLNGELNFHDQPGGIYSHDFHAFPAKFPPQLPRLFISKLTQPGDLVLDNMMGSATTLIEAVSLGRSALGFDIDPLAVLLANVKLTHLQADTLRPLAQGIIDRAQHALSNGSRAGLESELEGRFPEKTRQFVDYWFSPTAQIELAALLREIEKIEDAATRDFFLLSFSAIIITKSGGVSQAWDLAHTRPHLLKQGEAKKYRPALREFQKRVDKNLAGLENIPTSARAFASFGDAQSLPLASETVDLLFTSPPYASNAIDYMRAHKFSLVWMGKQVEELSSLRSKYIGGESIDREKLLLMPPETIRIIERIHAADSKKGQVLHRYYSEMSRALGEAFRVLKPGKAAFFVVGTSNMRGIDTQTQDCLSEIGASIGFEPVGIGIRQLDRDRRMMPARKNQTTSQIEQRMHEEYVVALLKPERS